jgi:BirA family biotin operon repressor/biotin-[acetyl-CoA-carboxylase] ligase
MALSEYPITELDSIDSTNNYAMQLIDANKAQQGMTIVAQSQTAGKGQRGRSWMDVPGESLLMSIITMPTVEIRHQFAFSAAIAVTIAKILQKLDDKWQVHIKWPNDIIVNDKKAGGILIENILRGARWTHGIVGLGLNIKQTFFHENLPDAISLRMASGREFDIAGLRDQIVEGVMDVVMNFPVPLAVMDAYNSLLYKKDQLQQFAGDGTSWTARLMHANLDGTLTVMLENGSVTNYYHGQVTWVW